MCHVEKKNCFFLRFLCRIFRADSDLLNKSIAKVAYVLYIELQQFIKIHYNLAVGSGFVVVDEDVGGCVVVAVILVWIVGGGEGNGILIIF